MEIHFYIYYLDSSSPTEHREQERDQEEAQETVVPRTNPGCSSALSGTEEMGTGRSGGRAALVGVSALCLFSLERGLPRPPVTPAGAVSSEPQSCVPLAEASPRPGTHKVYVGRLGVPEGQFFIAFVTTLTLHAVQVDFCNRNDSPRYRIQCNLTVIQWGGARRRRKSV